MENIVAITCPFSPTQKENFLFTTNMSNSHHTNTHTHTHTHTPMPSSLIDVYENGLLGMKTEKEMEFHHDDHGKRMTINYEVGSSSARIKETNKKESKMRKHRYAFHTRSQVDILDDGYRWRKYGQKAVKNNKFPRSYYRCTHGACNVKKQVQRLTKDEEVVVTTYEGIHSHPVERSTDNFEHILKQMQIYVPP